MADRLLLVFALVFFLLAGFSVPAHPRLDLIGLGLACFIASLLF